MQRFDHHQGSSPSVQLYDFSQAVKTQTYSSAHTLTQEWCQLMQNRQTNKLKQ